MYKKLFKKLSVLSLSALMLYTTIGEVKKVVHPPHYPIQEYVMKENGKELTKKRYPETYTNREEIIKYIKEVENELGFKKGFLERVAYIESSYNPYSVSNKNAWGVMQVKKDAFEELKRLYKVSKDYVYNYVDFKSFPYVDINNLKTFQKVKLKKDVKDEKIKKDILYYYSPSFILLLQYQDILKKDFNEIKYNVKDNILVGALYLKIIDIYFSTLQLVKENGKYRFIRRDPQHFEDRENLKIFPDELKEFIWVPYNMGITAFKRALTKHNGYLWKTLKYLPKETRIGIRKLHSSASRSS